MNILITGGANGQVGWELVRLGKETTHFITPLTRNQLDISSRKNVFDAIASHKPDIVINAAAYTAVDKAEDDQEAAFLANKLGPLYLAQACKEQEIPLFHISTDYVFDGTKPEPYLTDDKTNPKSVYGLSKWEGEEAIRNDLREHIILRTSWVFGRHGNNFLKTMLRLGRERDQLNVVADQRGSPTSAHSIAAALLSLCNQYQEKGNLPWGTYHFTGSPESSWYEFACMIFLAARKQGLLTKDIKVNPIKTEDYPTPAIRPQNSRLATDLTERYLNLEMPSWQEDLNEILSYLKSNELD